MRVESHIKPAQGREQDVNQTKRDPIKTKQHREVFRREVIDEDKMKEARKELEKVFEMLNQMTRVFNKRMDFFLHERADRIFVQIIDMETDAVIREIPPEEILDLIASIRDMVGIFLDKYV